MQDRNNSGPLVPVASVVILSDGASSWFKSFYFKSYLFLETSFTAFGTVIKRTDTSLSEGKEFFCLRIFRNIPQRGTSLLKEEYILPKYKILIKKNFSLKNSLPTYFTLPINRSSDLQVALWQWFLLASARNTTGT